ncbi:MAG: hypothetical protein KC620_27660, partial [Myxococcales bacterium]|nr:hypothetical protein [Myxococcales bacterium]
ARFLRSARVEAERVLMPLEKAMQAERDLLTEDEATLITHAIGQLREAMGGEDHRAVQDLTEMLDKVSAGFAQRRMEQALQTGLKDVAVDTLEGELADAPVGGGAHD